jgi:hypothetical protein
MLLVDGSRWAGSLLGVAVVEALGQRVPTFLSTGSVQALGRSS